jgi:hypothetical protein
LFVDGGLAQIWTIFILTYIYMSRFTIRAKEHIV